MRGGHVRWLAALVVAGGLHAILLSWPRQVFNPLSINNGPLHVVLLKPSTSTLTKPFRSAHAVEHTEEKQQQKQVTHAKKSQRRRVIPATDPVRVQRKTAPVKVIRSPGVEAVSVIRQHVRRALESDHSAVSDSQVLLSSADHHQSTAPHIPSFMPASAQSMLLANIHYPRVARRRGWQGKGEFQLAIVSRSIRNITMLVSTGHAMLDRAARQGLSGIDHIPVADGQYRLPIEFRLQ